MTENYPVIPVDRADDLHNLELAEQADLVLFMAGNQFMAMEEIVAGFRQEHPEVKHIFYETLPPGLELRQIMAGGALYRNRPISVPADIYSSVNRAAMEILVENHLVEPDGYFPYLHNRLTLMVPFGNPAGISTIEDLGRDEVRISQPDPRHEDIGHHIVDMYRLAGGESLVRRIMEEKKAAGTTIFTTVHHRETPARIKERIVDAGPVWATETAHARRRGLAFDVVEPGRQLDQRDRVNYFICRLNNGRNRENGKNFLSFILSPPAGAIYRKYGFVPHREQ